MKGKKDDYIFTDPSEEKTVFEWVAAERAFKNRDKDFWVTAISILVIVGIILFLIGESMLIIALCSILFLYYVLSTVPPQNVNYKITNRGLYFGELNYTWDVLERFWFKNSLDSEMMFIETKLRFPRQISFVINPADKEKLLDIMKRKIPLTENPPSAMDKTVKWFGNHLPLEKRQKTQ
ncbi:MAG: hypothetical protein WC841_03490 [Candidatus Shapirobacteria bacterium]|jgi:hypothetical protein